MDISIQDYYLIRKTIIEMLYDRSEQELKRFYFERGSLDIYNMIPYEAIQNIYETAQTEKNISYLNIELENEQQKVTVCFLNDAKNLSENINKFKRLYRLTDVIDEDKIYKSPISSKNYLIIVLCNKLKPPKDYFETSEMGLEIFWYKSLTFNVSKHVMVPKHELISNFKKDELKKVYFLDRLDKLPTILKEDPVAKYYGMRNGDVCRITRESPNIGTSIMYRYVSDI